jgi:hypothetical protein
MQKLRNALAMHRWTRLGRCPACMRTAFIFAFGALLVAAGATIAGLSGPALFGVWLAAAGFSALWFGHVFMFSRHATRALAVSRSAGPADPSRRAALIAFLRLLFVTAAITSFPKNLRAQGCNCFNDSDCYCPADYPSCFFNPSTGEAICCGPSNVGCSGPSLTWCCPPGSQCYGTDGQCLANQ